MANSQPATRKRARSKRDDKKQAGRGKSQNGDGKKAATYEEELAHYLQERIKPGLNRGAIPLLARSIAKEVAKRRPSEDADVAGDPTKDKDDDVRGKADDDDVRDEADDDVSAEEDDEVRGEADDDADDEEDDDDAQAEADDDFDDEEDDDVRGEADDDFDDEEDDAQAEADDDFDDEEDDDVEAEADDDFDDEEDDDVRGEADDDFDEEDDDDDVEAEADEDFSDEDDNGRSLEDEMRDLQANLGDDWILRVSMQGEETWLTAEKDDGSQHVEAPAADVLADVVELLNESGGRAS